MATVTRQKRRVSPLTRERHRERMLALSEEEKQRRLAAMQAGRQRARSPERLAEIEAEMDRLGGEFRALPRGHVRRREIVHELRRLGDQRASLKWGS